MNYSFILNPIALQKFFFFFEKRARVALDRDLGFQIISSILMKSSCTADGVVSSFVP